MKFSLYYDENIASEWRDFYINYSLIKKIILPITKEYKEKKKSMLFAKEKDLSEKLLDNHYQLQHNFRDELFLELEKLEFFYNANMKFYNNRLLKITEQLEFVKNNYIYIDQNETLQFALKELYKEVNLMRSFIHMNMRAKTRLIEKFKIYTSIYNSVLDVEVQVEKYINSSSIKESHNQLVDMNMKIDNVFSIYFSYIYNHNTHKILKDYLTPVYLTGKQSFLFGFINGMNLMLIIYCYFLSYYYNIDIDEDVEFKQIFPMFRGYTMCCLYIWLLAINVYAWDIAHVNYKICFNFKNHYSHFISILTRVSILTSVGVLMFLCYMVNRIKLPIIYEIVKYIPINMTPLVCWTVFFVFILLPIFNKPGMIYSYKLLLESLLIYVDFRHIWFLDQITSFVGPLRDIEYTLCYYSHYENTINEKSILCSSDRIIVLGLGIFPHLFRTFQCIRIIFNNSPFPQFFNMIKYIFAILVAVFSFMEKIDHRYDFVWWVTAGVSTIYSSYWDLKYDFGFFENSKGFPLREKLSYKNKFFYYLVLITNVFLRFMWVLSVSPEILSSFIRPEFLMVIVYSMEVIRRGMWNFIRVELQHIQICKEFRVVNYVELPFKKIKNGKFVLKNPNILEKVFSDKQSKRLDKLKTMGGSNELVRGISVEIDNPETRKDLLKNYLDDYNKQKEIYSENSSENKFTEEDGKESLLKK